MQEWIYRWLFFGVLGLIITVSMYSLIQKVISKTRHVFAHGQYYTLPPLLYAYNALEPYIDAQTMELHHDKHHQKYVDELNAALKDYPELQGKPVEELLTNLDKVPAVIRTAVRNNGGGHYNHSFFWTVMAPHNGQNPLGAVKEAIEKEFGSFANFKDQFTAAARSRFGSGWAWLNVDKHGKLGITSTPNQDSPLAEGLKPVLALDVWEHAYYLKYNNRRPDYIDAWWNVVNWQTVEDNFQKATATKR